MAKSLCLVLLIGFCKMTESTKTDPCTQRSTGIDIEGIGKLVVSSEALNFQDSIEYCEGFSGCQLWTPNNYAAEEGPLISGITINCEKNADMIYSIGVTNPSLGTLQDIKGNEFLFGSIASDLVDEDFTEGPKCTYLAGSNAESTVAEWEYFNLPCRKAQPICKCN